MASPFPGMDPYLEGYLWPDVHNRMSAAIAEALAPLIQPNYTARLELYTIQDDNAGGDVGILYPDVELLRRSQQTHETEASYGAGTSAKISPATLTLASPEPVEVRIPVVELRDRGRHQLITAIELLYPVNKRQPGLEPYREKRRRLHNAGVHLVEIDLIRRGERPIRHPYLPKSHYIVSLWRAAQQQIAIWAFNFNEPLPVIPIPLKAPDEDVPLQLGEALNSIYERAFYHLSINYEEMPPPPELTEEEQEWCRRLLQAQ
jgi:hypothetical protein